MNINHAADRLTAIASPAMKPLFFFASLFFSISLQFRVQLVNNFSVLYGDRYDATIVVTILEHWFNVIRGLSHWSETNYFFPYANTLAQTDGYFIVGIIYSVFRALGGDPFLSSELSNIAVRAIGFCAFFAACRKIFNWQFSWSLLAAVLFILSNNATIHGQRLQLATVALAPVLGILLSQTYIALRANSAKRFVAFGSAAGIFLGAWSLTCFYMTWFFLFFTVFFCIAFLISIDSTELKTLQNRVKSLKTSILIVIIITCLSLLPLLSVYLPKSKETGVRPYETVAGNTIPIEGILQTGTENFMFGRIYNGLLRLVSPHYTPVGEYYNTGFSPILFIIFVFGCILIFRERNFRGYRSFLAPLGISTITTWALSLNFTGYTAWYFVYHYFPGAKALAVVSAYQIFLTLPVIIIAVNYLAATSNKTPRALQLLIVLLLCLEELNSGYISLARADEIKRISLPNPPPKSCSSFYVSGWPNQSTITPMPEWINNYYAHNVTAMLIAELAQLPTINGIASFNPPDWNFSAPNKADYDQRVRIYADNHQITGLCKLNLDSKTWDTTW